jgi:hypothetical protein
MDRLSIARLSNTCKSPLGRVGEILEQKFIEDQREARLDLAFDFQDGLAGDATESWESHREFFLPLIHRLLMNSWGRCTESGCQNAMHRFATFPQCPHHHLKSLSSFYIVFPELFLMSNGKYY